MENIIEMMRKEVALRADFNLKSSFLLFHRSPQQKFTFDEFLFGLERLEMTVDPKQAMLLFQRYDSDEDGRLGFWEFSNILLPIDVRMREDVECRYIDHEMTADTTHLLKGLLKRLVDTETQVERIRSKLSKHMPSDLKSVFQEIDWLNRGFITK